MWILCGAWQGSYLENLQVVPLEVFLLGMGCTRAAFSAAKDCVANAGGVLVPSWTGSALTGGQQAQGQSVIFILNNGLGFICNHEHEKQQKYPAGDSHKQDGPATGWYRTQPHMAEVTGAGRSRGLVMMWP